MKYFKYVMLMVLFLVMNSCVTLYYPQGNYTPDGIKNYKESEKRIQREKRQYEKYHKKERNRIKKLQDGYPLY